MFNGSPNWPGGTRLTWLDLLDQDTRSSIDSCSCHEIDEALAGFDELVSQAEAMNKVGGSEHDDAQA